MTAALAVPATRQPTPWSPWCWLQVQIVSDYTEFNDPARVGYWMAPDAQPGSTGYTKWEADSVNAPPDDTVPVDYGEWVRPDAPTQHKWSSNWSTMKWTAVDCDLHSATFWTGNEPWAWNCSPGTGTLTLRDPDHVFFPLGGGTTPFDDIGINTPVRVIAHLTDKFDKNPADAAKRQPGRVLITGIILRITHNIPADGHATTTINFAEPHVMYGRVNRPETAVAAANAQLRCQQIAAMSDDPNAELLPIPYSTVGSSWFDGHPGLPTESWDNFVLQAGTVASDLWTEIARATNSVAMVTAVRLYPSSSGERPQDAVGNGTPRVFLLPPLKQPLAPPGGIRNPDAMGGDVRILSPDCSPPDATFNYTTDDAATRVKLSNCPVESIQLSHDDSALANVVSTAMVGGTAIVQTDANSIARWYRHTFQRHDLLYTEQIGNTNLRMGWRILERLRNAVYHISDSSYFMGEPRDFEFALGAAPVDNIKQDHAPVEPGRWMKLDWGWITADLRVTKLEHHITPTAWTVTHSYEIHNPVTHAEVP